MRFWPVQDSAYKTEVTPSRIDQNMLHITAIRGNGLDEGSQHTISMRNKKNYHQILPLI